MGLGLLGVFTAPNQADARMTGCFEVCVSDCAVNPVETCEDAGCFIEGVPTCTITNDCPELTLECSQKPSE